MPVEVHTMKIITRHCGITGECSVCGARDNENCRRKNDCTDWDHQFATKDSVVCKCGGAMRPVVQVVTQPTTTITLPPQPRWEDFDRDNMQDASRFIEATSAWERVCKAIIERKPDADR
jgi:hypothetical protein